MSPFQSRTRLVTCGPLQVRIHYLTLACLLVTVAAFVRLGLWQLDRAAEKVAARQQLEMEVSAHATPIEAIPAAELHADNPDLANRYVLLRGEYLNDRSILLVAEFHEGQIGYGVVTPLRLADSNQLVLVKRGWTTGILPPDTPPDLRPVAGPVTVGAQIHVPTTRTRQFGERIRLGEWPLRMRSLHMDIATQALGESLFPFAVRILDNQPGTLARHWPAVNPDVGQNLFYAMQWFLFAVLALLGGLFAASNLWQLLRKPRA